ncbi:UNVERIFIED_ORG: hypothetical protein GGD51_005059 [Rhizobium esperanzae]
MVNPSTYSAQLADGTISVHVDRSLVPPIEMFGFGQRINPNRSFLFVSKVLGRFLPIRPSVMGNAFDLLARQIPADIPGPVLFIGIAEAGIGLGAGVHRRFRELTGRGDAIYICSTRHDLKLPLLCEFEEEHSHAPRHLLHEPCEARLRDLVHGATGLVLVDDKASTGKTFANIFAALPAKIRLKLKHTVLLTLTDWSEGAARAEITGTVSEATIVSGRYSWTPRGDFTAATPQVPSCDRPKRPEVCPDVARDWARLGVVDHLQGLNANAADDGITLVLGTGEHVWQPFLLAERLEKEGAEVFYSSVTRSPLSKGHAIGSVLSFSDNYGGTVPHYLYNVDPALYSKIILCSETGPENVCASLMSALGDPIVLSDVEGE